MALPQGQQGGQSMAFTKSKRLSAAIVHEISIVDKYKLTYRNREDITNLPPGVLVVGSQNILSNVSERLEVRKGYVLDGQKSSVASPILSSFDWNSKGNSEIHMRAGFLTSAGNDGKLQFRYVDSSGIVRWQDLLTSLSSVSYNFTTFWDTTELVRLSLFVNGSSNIYEWNGAYDIISSVTSNSITVNNTIATTGFYNTRNKVITANGIDYTYTGISGKTFTGVTPDPTAGVSSAIAYYKLDEGSGSTASDATGNGNTAALINSPAWVTGIIGTAVSLNGTNQIIRDLSFSPTTANNFTVSFWANVTSNAGSYRAFFSATQSGGNDYSSGINIDMGNASTGSLSTINIETSGGSGTVNLLTGSPLAFGGWHHFAVVINSGVSVQLYVDGVAQGSRGHSGAVTHLDQIRIGGRYYSGSESGYLNGSMDEIGIWSRALSASEISQIYNNGSGSQYPFTQIVFQKVVTTPNSAFTAGNNQPPASFANGLISTLNNQIFLGSLTSSTLYMSAINSYVNYNFSSGRLPGEGATATLDDNIVAFIPQEEVMYISAGKNYWYNTKLTQSQNSIWNGSTIVTITNETFEVKLLKTNPRQGVQSQGLVGKMKNNVIAVTYEPTFDVLGRVDQILGTPQTTNISDDIKLDFDSYDFSGGNVFYWRYYLLVSVPKSGLIRMYSLNTKSWEAPQTLPISRFYTVNGELYGHSYNSSESYKLFSGYSDRATTIAKGNPYNVIANFSYQNFGTRTVLKNQNKFYIEGYISANTTLNCLINYEQDGNLTTQTFTVQGNDSALIGGFDKSNSLGKNPLGEQPGGSSINTSLTGLPPKFRVIKTFTRFDFYECQFSFTISGADQNFQLLAFGTNAAPSDTTNSFIEE